MRGVRSGMELSPDICNCSVSSRPAHYLFFLTYCDTDEVDIIALVANFFLKRQTNSYFISVLI